MGLVEIERFDGTGVGVRVARGCITGLRVRYILEKRMKQALGTLAVGGNGVTAILRGACGISFGKVLLKLR